MFAVIALLGKKLLRNAKQHSR